jgi:hypothetical protein
VNSENSNRGGKLLFTHELPPATEAAGMALGPVLGDRLFKLVAGKTTATSG